MEYSEIIDPAAQKKKDKSKESLDIDKIFDELKVLSRKIEMTKSTLHEEVGKLQKKLDAIRAKLNPEEWSYFDRRLEYIERLLTDLSSGKLRRGDFEYDPKRRVRESIKSQKHLSNLVAKFGVKGLKLVKARGGSKSAINYGLQLDDAYIGSFAVGHMFGGHYADAFIHNDIIKLLDWKYVRHTLEAKEINVIDASFPVTVNISKDGRELLKRLCISISAKGKIEGVRINNRIASISTKTTKSVTIRVVGANSNHFTMTLANTDGSRENIEFNGNYGKAIRPKYPDSI